MEAWTVLVVEIGGVYAVIDYVPLVLAGHLQHRVMCGAVDLLVGTLDEDDWLVGNLDRTETRCRCAEGHMVVG
jgi:hypothetical protein